MKNKKLKNEIIDDVKPLTFNFISSDDSLFDKIKKIVESAGYGLMETLSEEQKIQMYEDKIKSLFKENYGREVYFVKDSNITNDINVYLLRSDK